MPVSNSTSHPTFISISHTANLLGLTVQSIRNYSNSGRLRAYRIGSLGHRRFKMADVLELVGENGCGQKKEGATHNLIGYARVSTPSQNLENQINRLKEFAKEEYGHENLKIIQDVASGISMNRRGLNSLIDMVLSGRLSGATVLVSYFDRLLRFNGHALIEKVFRANSTSIRYIEEKADKSLEEELSLELIQISTIYSARYNGNKAASIIRVDLDEDAVKKIMLHRSEGKSVEAIRKLLAREKITSTKSKKISASKIWQIIREGNKYVADAVSGNQIIKLFVADSCKKSTGKFYCDHNPHTVEVSKLYAAYETYCRQRSYETKSLTYFTRFVSKDMGFAKKRRKEQHKQGVYVTYFSNIDLRYPNRK